MNGSDDPLSEHDRMRYRRMWFAYGIHPYCRQFAPQGCLKNRECAECRTCSVCNGTLRIEYREQVVTSRMIKKELEYICVQCGARIERGQFITEAIHQPGELMNKNIPPFCSVRSCQHRTWTGSKIEIAEKNHLVCDLHRRQHQRWVRMGRSDDRAHLIIGDYGLEMTIRRKE